jgi:predicted dehydrogenase
MIDAMRSGNAVTVGILGSGFGLYGYLPAVLGLGEHVVMPAHYREKLLSRADVRHLDRRVEWAAGGDEEIFATATALIIAQRPADQVRAVQSALTATSIKRLLLEKPLAPSPEAAAGILDSLEKAGRSVRIGFTFNGTAWAEALAFWMAGASPGATLDIVWQFQAHHYMNAIQNWKRRVSEGGGALRYYGIQLIGLLAKLGYDAVLASELGSDAADDAARWTATVTGPGRPSCRLAVDSRNSEALFAITGEELACSAFQLLLRDPFEDAPVEGARDRRVALLSRLCQSLLREPSGTPDWCRRSVDLWREAETLAGLSEARSR